MPNTAKSAVAGKLTLIHSEDKNPQVTLKPGMKLSVISVKLADATLKNLPSIGARLCGGSGTCVALVNIADEVETGGTRAAR